MTDLEPEALERALNVFRDELYYKDGPATFDAVLPKAIAAYLSHRRAALPAETREVVAKLNSLGVTRQEWPKQTTLYFSHSGGRVHLCEVDPFFEKAVGLAEKAARLLTEQAALLAQPPATQEQE